MISIVIPAYNEESCIEDTISRCQSILASIGDENSEVIVVDDCSSDRTFELASNSTANVVHHPHNIGYGRSLKDGINLAKNDIIVITDADGTYPIESIPDLFYEYKKGFDMVVGARTGKHYKESFKKRILRWILKSLVEFTAGRKIDDINSGLRIFSKKTISEYFSTLCDTFSFTTSVTLAYMMTGKFVKYIPIEYHKRIGATKVRLFKDAKRTLQFIIEAIIYYNPIKIFIVLSSILVFFSLISFCLGLILELHTGFQLGSGFLIAAILVFGFGLIAVLLKQILHEIK